MKKVGGGIAERFFGSKKEGGTGGREEVCEPGKQSLGGRGIFTDKKLGGNSRFSSLR